MSAKFLYFPKIYFQFLSIHTYNSYDVNHFDRLIVMSNELWNRRFKDDLVLLTIINNVANVKTTFEVKQNRSLPTTRTKLTNK